MPSLSQRFGPPLRRLGLRPTRAALLLTGIFAGTTALWEVTTIWGSAWASHLPRVPLPLSPLMLLDADTLPALHLSALLLNTFVAGPGGPLNLLLLCGLAVAFSWPVVRAWWRRRPAQLAGSVVGFFGAIYLLDRLLLPQVGWSLASGALLLVWIVPAEEARWGARRLLIFCLIIVTATNLFGGLLLWGAPGLRLALVGEATMALNGLGPLIDALLTVWILMAGAQRMFGVEVRKLIWVLVALRALDLLFASAVAGAMGLFAIWLARALVLGVGRPEVLIDRARLWLIDRRLRRRRARFKVLDGGRTLHRVEELG